MRVTFVRLTALLGMFVLAYLIVANPVVSQDTVKDDEFESQMSRNKLPKVETLDAFADQVRRMQLLGADNALIANHMSRLIDQRLEATNKPGGESLFNPFVGDVEAARRRRWRPIDDFVKGNDGQAGKPISDGRMFASLSQLAWDNRVGNCSESANVAYAVLRQAGIPVRIFTSTTGGGHEFAVIGLDNNADPSDPSSWGKNARIVDGWLGYSLTPQDALSHRHVFGGRRQDSQGTPIVSDQTDAFDNPRQQAIYDQIGEKGILAFVVVDEEDKPVVGATVHLAADEPQDAVTSGQGLANMRCYPGLATIEVTTPKTMGFQPAQAATQVESRRIITLRVTLKKQDLISVPALEGKKIQNAVAELKSLELVCTPALGPAATDPQQAEVVYQQVPAAGTRVAKGAKIKLLFNAKPKLKVPNVIGLKKAEAEKKIEAEGFKPSGEEESQKATVSAISAADAGKVFEQIPSAEAMATLGSIVKFRYLAAAASSGGSSTGANDEQIKPIAGTFNAIIQGHNYDDWRAFVDLKKKPFEDPDSHSIPLTVTIEPSGAITGKCNYQIPNEEMLYDRSEYKVFVKRFRFEMQGLIDWTTGNIKLNIVNGRDEVRQEQGEGKQFYVALYALNFESSLAGFMVKKKFMGVSTFGPKAFEKYQATWINDSRDPPKDREVLRKIKILQEIDFSGYPAINSTSDHGDTARAQKGSDEESPLWFLAIVGPAPPEPAPSGQYLAFAIQPQKAVMRIGERKNFQAVAMTGNNDDGTDVTRFARWQNGPDFTATQVGTFAIEAKYRTKEGIELEDRATITVTQ